MDNHLWEHEDIVVAKLIVCLEYVSRLCVTGIGCPAGKLGYT